METYSRLLCGLLLALLSFASSAQNVIEVPADQPTIQAGIDAAVNGDSVVVAPGTYHEVLNFHGKAIALLSADGPLVTIIDGQQRNSVFTFESGETRSSMVSGFTIRNAERHSAQTRDSPNPGKAISLLQGKAFLCGAL